MTAHDTAACRRRGRSRTCVCPRTRTPARIVHAAVRRDAATSRRRHGHLEPRRVGRSEEHTSELQSLAYLVCRLLLEKKTKHRSRIILRTTQGKGHDCADHVLPS